jgi:steroid Delta-isomerase
MPGPAVDLIRRFGAVEDDQRYTKLLDVFTDDAVYVDPFAGPQRGRAQIASFMAHMEEVVPKAGVVFEDWQVEADTTCGWATWTMTAPGPDGERIGVPGQSLYKLRHDGGPDDETGELKVCFVNDYVDQASYARLRPGGPAPDFEVGHGVGAGLVPPSSTGGADVIDRYWTMQINRRYRDMHVLFSDDSSFTDIVFGEHHGVAAVTEYLNSIEAKMHAMGASFELVDSIGDETVGWAQWWCHVPHGKFAGWSLYRFRDALITFEADIFDVVLATDFATQPR